MCCGKAAQCIPVYKIMSPHISVFSTNREAFGKAFDSRRPAAIASRLNSPLVKH